MKFDEEKMEWEEDIEIQVNEFAVEYAGCGSHQMLIKLRMGKDNMEILRDKLIRLLDPEVDRVLLEQEAKIARQKIQDEKDRGLL
jgi:hypothetical protein